MEWRVIPAVVYSGVTSRGQYSGDFVNVFFCGLLGGNSVSESNNWVGLIVMRPGTLHQPLYVPTYLWMPGFRKFTTSLDSIKTLTCKPVRCQLFHVGHLSLALTCTT
jgi:hypothetical protein